MEVKSSESQGSKSESNPNVHINLPESTAGRISKGLSGSLSGGGNKNVHIDDEVKKDSSS